MTKHNLSLTYKPKIQAVIDGRCRQTIRATNKFKVGDLISFHGWEGKPYRSKWSFRTPYFELKEVINLKIGIIGVSFVETNEWHTWNNLNELAELDYINPPTGEALRDTLFGLNGNLNKAQIIRW